MQPKIIWGEISDRSKFAYDATGAYVPEATTFLMVGNHLPYLFCALNSPLSEWFFSKVGTTTGVGTVRWKKYTIQELILPIITKKEEEYFSSNIDLFLSDKISIEDFTKRVNDRIYDIAGLSEEEKRYIKGESL